MGNIKLRGFILWNQLSAHHTTQQKNISSFFTHLSDYCYDRHNIWVFVPHYDIPIPLSHMMNPVTSEWIYHSTTNTISYTIPQMYRINESYHVAWLSTQLVIDSNDDHDEFDIDEFMSTFTISTPSPLIIPSLSIIYICWCIYMKKWFPTTSIVTFNMIDSQGDEHQLILDDKKSEEIKIEIHMV